MQKRENTLIDPDGDHSNGHSHHVHSHKGHHHSPNVDQTNLRRVGFAALLTGFFMMAEIIGGYISGSLALLADAGHMFTDFVALSMAWVAFLIGRRPATGVYSFGLGRLSILVAFINGLSLFLVAALIVKEAFERFLEPQAILAGPMLYIALGGLCVNILVFGILRGADQHNLNIRGAVLHVMGDLLGSVAAILAALTILLTGWTPVDPILSVFVALIILRSARHLVKESAHILLEGAPRNTDCEKVNRYLVENISSLMALENIKIWSITPEHPHIMLRAIIEENADHEAVKQEIISHLAKQFSLHHVNIEIVQRDLGI